MTYGRVRSSNSTNHMCVTSHLRSSGACLCWRPCSICIMPMTMFIWGSSQPWSTTLRKAERRVICLVVSFDRAGLGCTFSCLSALLKSATARKFKWRNGHGKGIKNCKDVAFIERTCTDQSVEVGCSSGRSDLFSSTLPRVRESCQT